jgi:Lamin Tail Domain
MRSGKLKWLLAILLSALIVVVAQAAIQEANYIPLTYKNFELTQTFTPSPSLTLTATVTPTGTITPPLISYTPTRSPTPTLTPTLVPGVYIIQIVYNPPNPMDEYVYIRNQNNWFVDLTGWTLRDDNKNIYTFPRFTLTNYAYVKVWTKSGTKDPDNLYWGRSEPVWNDYGECAYLRDAGGVLKDNYCYGTLSYQNP